MALMEKELTENEGMLLALVLQQQPITAYRLLKLYEHSPLSSINASKGQVYPAIRRLRKRGLLEGRKIVGDGRKSEHLSASNEGREAARRWTQCIDSSLIVLDDPLRTRIFSFDLLTREEQIHWIERAKSLVKQRWALVDEHNRTVTAPFQYFAQRYVIETLKVKLEWLDELLIHISGE